MRDAEPVPDLIAVKGKLKSSYETKAPALCIEILSPGDRLRRTLKKAHAYLSWGSECVWIIDPQQRTAWSLSRDNGSEPVWIPPDGSLAVAETSLNLEAIFAEVDSVVESDDAAL